MKNNYSFLLVFVAFISIAAYQSSNHVSKKAHQNYFGDASALGSEENALARIEYERMRLCDPFTGKIPLYIREKELAFAATLPNDGDVVLSRGTSGLVNWDPRGPWNVGGRTRAFAIDVANENNFIAGAASGGMWRSTNGGASWNPTTTLTQHQSVTCVVQDVRNNHRNVWYYGSGEGYGQSASGGGAYYIGYGIYKSTDSAQTWTPLASTTSTNTTGFDVWGDVVWDIAIDAHDTVTDILYAASYGAIYRSANGGNTWTIAKGSALANGTSYFTDVEVTPSGVVYASLSSDGPANDKGIWRSANGTNYTNILPPNFPATYNRFKICYDPSNENVLYFLGNTPGFGQPDTNFLGTVEWNSLWKYTYLSGNGSGVGGVWEDRSANLPTTGGTFDKFQSQGSYDIVVRVKPNDPNTLFIGGTNLYRSTNAFADPSQTTFIGGYQQGTELPVVQQYANHHPDQHELVFLQSDPNIMISANDGGVFKTIDNTAQTVNWTSLNNGYINTQFYTCAIDHAATDDVIIAGAQDNGSWFTNSANFLNPWVTPRGGDGSYCAIADNKSAYYFSIQNGKMMKAKLDAAGAVDSFARIDPIGGDSSYIFINPYAVDPNDNKLMYLAGGKHLWRNNDLNGIPYAGNWDSISTNWVMFPDTLPSTTMRISSIAVSTSPANRVYYGTNNRRLYRVNNANTGLPARTDITSLTGANAFPTSSTAAVNISCVALDPTNADHILVSFSNYGVYSIYYSPDGGTSWQKSAGNLEMNASGTGNGPSVRWLSIMPVTGGTVYLAATSTGIYATTQLNGLNTVWVQQGANTIGNAVCDMIDYRSTDGLVVVATHGHGIFSTHITNINDVVGIEDMNVENLNTLKVYPNPMSSHATIQFDLRKAEKIRLELLNEAGQTVKILLDAKQEEGVHQIGIERNQLSPGLYYVRLTGISSVVNKVMLQ